MKYETKMVETHAAPYRKVLVVWDLRYHCRAFLQSSLCAAPLIRILAGIGDR
jgi:hypothetical protein